MANIISRSVTATLSDVTLEHVRVGQPYKPSFAEATDVAQWSLMAVAAPNTKAFDAMLDLKEAGLPVQLDGDNLTLNLKQYETTRAGKANTIGVFDSEYTELSMEDRMTVGNGSKGHVVFYYRAYANQHGVGMTATLTDVVVTEKVEFTPETPAERMKRLFG